MTVTSDPAAPYTMLVNTGGGSFTDSTGQHWSADQPYTPGSWGYAGGGKLSTLDAIGNTTNDPLYQSARNGKFSYRFDVPDGRYDVTLHFAEINFKAQGKRIFDVRIEGTVLENYDIFAAAGHDVAVSLTFPSVEVNDGRLDIEFVPVVSKAIISAIAIEDRSQ